MSLFPPQYIPSHQGFFLIDTIVLPKKEGGVKRKKAEKRDIKEIQVQERNVEREERSEEREIRSEEKERSTEWEGGQE